MLHALHPTRRVRRRRTNRNQPIHTRGAAVVELAVLLPALALLFVIAVDFGRVFYFSLTLQNCARAGAIYASDASLANESPFASVEEAARSDAVDLTPAPTVESKTGSDDGGREYVEVTVMYPFRSITMLPGLPTKMNLSRSVRMYSAAIIPNTD